MQIQLALTNLEKNWREVIVNWLEKNKKREKQNRYELSKESIEYLLHKDLETEESIKLYNEINTSFKTKMQERLTRVTNEKTALENFLK